MILDAVELDLRCHLTDFALFCFNPNIRYSINGLSCRINDEYEPSAREWREGGRGLPDAFAVEWRKGTRARTARGIPELRDTREKETQSRVKRALHPERRQLLGEGVS